MRTTFLAAVLITTPALAEEEAVLDPYGEAVQLEPVEPAPETSVLAAYAPVVLVGVMLESGQALLWDEQASEYRLVRVGDVLYSWKVVAIEEEQLVLTMKDLRDELPLSLAPKKQKKVAKKKGPPTIVVAAQEETAELRATEPVPAPVPVPVPVPVPATVSVPVPVPAPVPVPVPATVPAPVPVPVPATEPAPSSTSEPTPFVEPAPPVVSSTIHTGTARAVPTVEERKILYRGDIDRELGDFSKLMANASVVQAPDGGVLVTRLEPTSWLYAIGLRQGDLVESVAGQRIGSVEDGARVYARVRVAKNFQVEILRGEKRVKIRYDVR